MMAYIYAGVAAVILVLGGATWIQTERLDAKTKELETFKAETAALGKAAQHEADEKYARAINEKEEANAENAQAISTLNASIAKLRAQRAGTNLVSAPAAASKRPELACYDRSLLTGALSGYEGEIEGFIAEGGKAAVDLNTAKEWARSLR